MGGGDVASDLGLGADQDGVDPSPWTPGGERRGPRRDGVDQAWPGNGVVYFARLSAQRTKSKMSKIVSAPESAPESMKAKMIVTFQKAMSVLPEKFSKNKFLLRAERQVG